VNERQPNQRGFALWLLRQFGPENDREAIIGDLLESLGDGRSATRLWREVMIALSVRLSKGLRIHWQELCFSVAGTALIVGVLLPLRITRSPAIVRMWVWGFGLGWPLSSVYDFGFRALRPALMTLTVLIVFLVSKRTLNRVNILRALLVSLPLFVSWFLLVALYASGSNYSSWRMVGWAPYFLALLIPAWWSRSTTAPPRRERAESNSGG
jgi:hypothetical protein